jgi:glycosyltransferase involved in cell wall biosynthesis
LPRFAIVIPCFNNERTIREAIETALAQRHGDFAVVVGDNGSKDQSPTIIDAFDDPRLIKRLHRETLPKTDNWNRAYGDAPDCDYLVTLHGDDRLAPDALAAIAAQADRGAPPLIHGRFEVIDAHGNRQRTVGIPFDYTASRDEFRRMQIAANVVGVAGVSMRTDLFHRLGGWPPEWTYMQDVEMWWRLAEFGPVRHTSAILGDYRVFDIPINPAFVDEIGRWTQAHIADFAATDPARQAGWDGLATYRALLESKPDFAASTAGLDLDALLGPRPVGSRNPGRRQRLFRLAIVARTLLSTDRRNGHGRFASLTPA